MHRIDPGVHASRKGLKKEIKPEEKQKGSDKHKGTAQRKHSEKENYTTSMIQTTLGT